MTIVKNAREAIKIAKEVIYEAGYTVSRIVDTEYDEDDEIWKVIAFSGDTEIELSITKTGEVDEFSTNS